VEDFAAKMAAALAKGGIVSKQKKTNELYLTTGLPHLDYALSGRWVGGGIKSGRMCEFAGPPSSGKTLTAQYVMMAAQRAGGIAAFHDHEETFMPHLFESFGGDARPGKLTMEEPRSFEESIDKAVDWMTLARESEIIPPEAPMVVVFDSLHSMVPAANLERDRSNAANMREKLALAQATASELPAFAKFVSEQNCVAIFLNHLKTKPGVVYGDPRYTPGGEAIDFYSSIRLFLSRRMLKDAKTKEVNGQIITAEAVKNKTYQPFKKADWVFKLKDGVGYIDVIESMLMALKDMGKLNVSGAYIEWEGKKKYLGPLAEELNLTPDESMQKLIAIAEGTASA